MVVCLRKLDVLHSHVAPSKTRFRSYFVAACSLVVQVLVFGLLAPAQGQSPPAEVLLPLIAVDHRGQPVSDLRPESLVVWDDKTQISSGVKLIPGTGLPLRVGILIDTSNSQRDNELYKAGVASVKDFVNQVLRLDEDRVFFELFSTTAEATLLLSKQQLSGISFPFQVGGATVLYDAIALACTDRMGKPDSRTPMRRVLIILSDGEDNQSHISRAKAEAFPVSSGVLVFAISTNNSGRELKGDAVLNHFAKASGGTAYTGLRQREIAKVFGQIREQIESMYYVAYVPPVTPRNGDVHKVDVQPAKGLKREFRTPKFYAWNP